MDQDGIKVTQLVHTTLTSKMSKIVGTKSYPVFILPRPEEMSTRPKLIVLVLGDSNC